MKKVSDKIRNIRKVKRASEAEQEAALAVKEPVVDLVQQVTAEYELCWMFCRPRIQEWLRRLKLYNNQAREKDKVGDNSLYTIHQTLLASLYDDKLAVTFKGREEGDEDKAQNLNVLAEYDDDEMQKAEHDYAWDWDALFFGRGLSLFNDFDVTSKTPIPQVLDPTTFIRDPKATSVNGDRSEKGRMRFGGWEVRMTMEELKANEAYFNLDKLIKGNEDLMSLTSDATRQRDVAQGREDTANWETQTTNFHYQILRWFTLIGGVKYLVELANNRTLLIRKQKIPFLVWPIIDRSFSPISHDWDGVSVADIIEDKQRFRAALINVAGDTAKADLNGMYLFHEDRFRKSQDFNFKFGKWIPVKGQGALQDAAQPLQMKQISNQVKFIMDFLDVSAKKAAATPELQQGQVSSEKRTLGELELVAKGTDTRYSLTAKIFGWSEKKFWRQWYAIYDEYFDSSLGEKISRLEGAFGTKWQPIRRSDIITGNTLGPDIEIESKVLSEARKVRNYQMWSNYALTAIQYPDTDKTYLLRKLGKLLMPKDEVERVIPLSVDEYEAKQAVEMLNNDEKPPLKLEQNHEVFIRMLAGAKDSPLTRAYIHAHVYLFMQARANPQMFPPNLAEQQAQLQAQMSRKQSQQQLTPGQPGAGTPSPQIA